MDSLAHLPPQTPPSSSLHLWQEVGYKGWIFPPAPSSSLAFLPPGAGAGRGQRKQSAAPAHSHSLPHFLLWEDGLLPPPPWLGTWPWCQVSTEFLESEAPAWAPAGPLTSLCVTSFTSFLPQPRALSPNLLVVKFCSSGGGRIQWKEGLFGSRGHIE